MVMMVLVIAVYIAVCVAAVVSGHWLQRRLCIFTENGGWRFKRGWKFSMCSNPPTFQRLSLLVVGHKTSRNHTWSVKAQHEVKLEIKKRFYV